MSLVIPRFDRSAVGRAADAEIVGGSSAKVRLLVDSSATGGALSTVRVTLGKGADCARAHRRDRSAEMFYCSMARYKYSRAPRLLWPNRVMLSSFRRDAACVLNPACRECRPLDRDRTGRGAIRVLPPTHSYRARITHSRSARRCQRRRREFVRREIANPLLGSWISSSPSGIARWLSGRAGRLPRSSVAASTGWREFARREIG